MITKRSYVTIMLINCTAADVDRTAGEVLKCRYRLLMWWLWFFFLLYLFIVQCICHFSAFQSSFNTRIKAASIPGNWKNVVLLLCRGESSRMIRLKAVGDLVCLEKREGVTTPRMGDLRSKEEEPALASHQVCSPVHQLITEPEA